MREKSMPQRLLSLLLACVICLTCAPTAFAESAVAASMRLMKTEGTVSVSNSSGRTVTQTERMSLRSGYQLETAEKSYAWINLDDVKLAEMDAVTEIGIRKKGKKLDILVESGSLLFKVDEPLEGDENLNIRTSTMAIGVRGTCGWVKVIDQWTSRIYILEGSVEASVSDPVSGAVKTETISAGEMAVCTVYPQDRSGSKCDIIRQDFTVADIDGFVLAELTPDKTVCDKIYEESGLDLRDPSVKPAEKLKQDQEKVRDQLAEIETQLREQENSVSTDPVWTDPTPDETITVPATPNAGGSGGGSGGSGGSGGGGGGGSATPPAPTETVTLTMPQTAAAVNSALARSAVRQVVLLPGTARASAVNHLEVDSALTVPAGKTLTLQNGVGLTLLTNQPLAVYGTLSVGGVCYLFGNLTAGSGAVIKAKGFSLDMPDYTAWERSAEPDANGFYFLTYTGRTFTVTFEANGGDVAPGKLCTGADGRLAALPTPVREGYAFNGWFTAADGGKQITTDTLFTQDTTVYAHWTKEGKIVITYDANGGTGNGTTSALIHVSPTLTTVKWDEIPVPTREGYTFAGWYTEPTGGILLTTSYNVTASMTIYAHWTADETSGVTWRYDEPAKTLYIMGSGPMEDYPTSINRPWYQYKEEIQSVVIENGITSIGDSAFCECGSLTSVTIPNSVTSIGETAFWKCTALTSVTIPNRVATIGGRAFMECSSLTSITIPDSVTSIGFAAFSNCGSLASVTLPKGIASISESAFADCHSLTSVTIPDSVTLIGSGAFARCDGLTSVTIPASVAGIGDYAFDGCAKLTDVYYGGTAAQWETVEIGIRNDPLRSANIHFNGGEDEWRYDEATKTLYITGSGPMKNYGDPNDRPWSQYTEEIQSVIIENGITSIGSTAFYFCTSLTSATIPDSVTSVEQYAFRGDASLKDVYYGGDEAQWEAITLGNGNDPLRNATIHFNGGEEGVTWRYDEATKTLYITGSGPMEGYLNANDRPWNQYASEIQSVVIENGITSVGDRAFSNCSSLTSVTIPNSVTSINNSAFSGCSGLTSVTIPNSVTSIGQNAFFLSGLTSVNIPDSVATIGSRAFGSSRLTSVIIPDSVTSIGEIAFSECSNLTSVKISNNVTSIEAGAFSTCRKLTSVAIPNGVTSIGQNAFNNCSGLTSVTIPSSVTTIGDYAFTSCSRLTNVTIPNGVTSIGQDAFYSCTSLTSVTIPNSVTSFGDRVFGDCSNLTSVTIPNRITSISASAFTGCSNLTSVTIPNSVTSIGAGAFTSCTSLTSVTIPDSVTSIDRRAFLSCTKLTDIYFGGTETQWNAISIGTGAIPDTVTIHYNSRTRSVVSNAGTAGYTDVPAGAAYAEAVNYCKVNNLMTGTSATEFTPDGTLTRAMMVTVLHRLAGKPAAASTASFADVPAGKWYTDAISWANSKGIVLGYNATTFGVNDPVTHEQVALIFQRYSGDPTVRTEGADSPKTPATRAEIAVTLMNFAKSRKPGALSVLSAIDVMCAPSGIAVDQNGVLLVTDLYNKQVWKVLNRAGTTYAGGATVPDLYGQPLGGYNDGNLTGSYFKEPWAVAPFLDGWAVSDTANNAVRLVTGGGIQTLNAASREKLTVTNLGVAFNRPTGLAADEDGNLYVSDTGSGTVRRVSPQGGASTVAKGLSDPTGLCWKDGALYIAETGRNRILQLKDGKITVLAGSGSDGSAGGRAAQASFSAPQGVAVGEDGSVYVADTGNGAVRMIKSGTVSTLAVRDPAQLSGDMISPVGLLLQGGSLYVCDPFVRKIFVLAVA